MKCAGSVENPESSSHDSCSYSVRRTVLVLVLVIETVILPDLPFEYEYEYRFAEHEYQARRAVRTAK